MFDRVYCYPNSRVLINKLGITDADELFEMEKRLTLLRLQELQENPIKGDFDFSHLKAIHQYIFQDIYKWAGQERTVEIGKGNLFCTTACIHSYARAVFDRYFQQCYSARNNFDEYILVLANNYGDLNALHPFREGNGRAQREFARLVCLECGYDFNLSGTTHKEMLAASVLSFDKGDSSAFVKIFSSAVTPHQDFVEKNSGQLDILTCDDLIIGLPSGYDYYEYDGSEKEKIEKYNIYYQEKILQSTPRFSAGSTA